MKIIEFIKKQRSTKHTITIIIYILLLSLPLTVDAKTVLVWELDNFFSNPFCKSCTDISPISAMDDNFIVRIDKGDRIKFTNMGLNDHNVLNDVVEINGKIFFDGELFKGETQKPGQAYLTPIFEKDGVIPFFCQIHGRSMSGTIIVRVEKAFTLSCDHTLAKGIFGIETLTMELGDVESCTLRVNKFEQGTDIEISSNFNDDIWSSINIDPQNGFVDEDGVLELTISAVNEGIDWIAWAIPNKDGIIEFNRRSYENGYALGMFVIVKR